MLTGNSTYATRPIACKVGDSIFYIHSSWLCASPRLRAWLTNLLATEVQDRVISIEGTVWEFEIFVKFLQRKAIARKKFSLTLAPFQYDVQFLIRLAKLYTTGERYLLPEFRRAVYDQFIEWQEDYETTVEELCELMVVASREITARTPSDDPMRQAIFCLGAKNL
jgi:hypothetical protein